MQSTPPGQQDLTAPSPFDSAISDARSLNGILRDIHQSMNYQILLNCEVLKKTEMAVSEETIVSQVGDDGNPETAKKPYYAFKRERIEDLVCHPLRMALGRLKGLQRVVDEMQKKIEQLKLSTGNKPADSSQT